MTTETTGTAEPIAFKAEVRQLLDILAHSLYTERDVFLRELISNASDAIRRFQFELLTNQDVLDPEAELAIRVAVDRDARTITIQDSGIGMTREEAVENLGTIAQSGARAFLKRASENKATTTEIIGQFGVGFYSVFMVADRVTVHTRSFHPAAEPIIWEATGGDTYTIVPGDRTERGTTITLHLKQDAEEFANTWRIEQIIKKHSNFVAYPIYMDERRINEDQALWRQTPRTVEADTYTAFYRQLTLDSDEPLLHLHISTDAPVDLHAILFVPARRERGLIERRIEGTIKLYSRKVLIQEDTKDLLPNFLRFVEGVVDSEDIPLNVSREVAQNSPVMQRIRKSLSGRMLREISELAEKDTEKYARFWREFGVFFKEGMATDYEHRDDLLKLLRFHSTHSNEEHALTALAEYKSRMIDGQNEIYYVMANDLEAARRSPHLDPLQARGLEVLLLTDMVDVIMLTGLRDYEGHQLRNIDDASLELPGEAPENEYGDLTEEEFGALTKRISDVLGERVKAVRASKVLRGNPVRLVSEEGTAGREMQRIEQLLG
ncbi:MAG: molecular chaperone HtpG, partial [Chloroflexaceae bacterium]|nr:molecular chaperone HtpG [Chloroflexaceae bacterium]